MAKFIAEQFHLDNLVATFDELGVTVKWRGLDNSVDDYLIGQLLLTQKSFNEKVILFNAIIDTWFTKKLIEIVTEGGITEASRLDVNKAQNTFKTLKTHVKKLLMSTKEMKSYEFYLDKIEEMSERIKGFKVVVNE